MLRYSICTKTGWDWLVKMIDYEPFWKTLDKSDENWYTLVHKHDINPATLHRLKHNKPISTVTIDLFCEILHCEVSDIVRYIPNDNTSDK